MFNTKIPLYGIFIIIAIISGLLVIYKNSKYLYFKDDEMIGFLLYIVLGGFFGAKYFSFVMNYEKYNGIFEFKNIGLSSYGAVIGILFLIFLFSKQYKKNFKELLYIILPAMPLMYGIGKIGCFISGCCYGIEYNGLFSVSYKYSHSAPVDVGLFPIQLLESIIFIIIFIYLFNKIKKDKVNNNIIGKTFIICGGFKFLLDFLRIDHMNKLITINQIVSILFVLIGLCIILIERKNNRFIKAQI